MPEPSLSELTNIPSDAALGTAGLSDYVPQMHQVNQQIFEAAKFKAQMDWTKYTQFLQNFKEVTKDANEIAKMDIARPDREYLQGELAGIFSEIEKNPKSSLGGKGMFDIQNRLQKVASDATQSKQDNLFDVYHRQFLDRVPDMKTDENKAKVDNFLTGQKLGQRQPYMLDAANVWDAGKMYEGLIKQSTNPYSENKFAQDEKGNKLQGYMPQVETGDEVNPHKVFELWKMAMKNPEIKKGVESNYNKLPKEAKDKYENGGGGLERYMADIGLGYLNAHFPEGSYDKTKEGNYRFGKKLSELKADPNYLGAERLAEQQRNDKEKNAIEWYNAKTGRIKATKSDGSIIGTGIQGNALNGIPLTDETKKDGEYTLTPQAGKQYLGQLQQVMGDKVLPDGLIKSNDEADAISVNVKGGIIQSIKVAGKVFTRQEIENMQKQRDKEAKGSEHQQYPLEQSYLSNNAPQKEEVLSTDAADWKQEGKNWRYKNGKLYDPKGKIVKEK